DTGDLSAFHRSRARLATVTGVQARARFGQLAGDGIWVRQFAEKPLETGWINGGFFVFEREVLELISPAPACVLEHEPLEWLASPRPLAGDRHQGYRQCAGTPRGVRLPRA